MILDDVVCSHTFNIHTETIPDLTPGAMYYNNIHAKWQSNFFQQTVCWLSIS